MNFFEAVRSTYSKYFQSSGRSPRSEYWYFLLFMLIVDTCLMNFTEIGVLATGIFGLATFVPFTMLLIRRFHDIGWSDWWASYPLVGFVVTRVIPDLLPADHPFLTFVLFLALAEKDNGKVDLYENELEDWDKQVQVQRGKVLSFWDVTCETMLSQGYDTNMVCDN